MQLAARVLLSYLFLENCYRDNKRNFEKQSLGPVLFQQVQGDAFCTFMHDQGLLAYTGYSFYPKKITESSPKKLQNHPETFWADAQNKPCLLLSASLVQVILV